MAKRINDRLIKPRSAEGKEIYPLIQDVIERHHPELDEARIGAAWKVEGWAPDADDRYVLGKMIKLTELQRQASNLDAVIVLSQPGWEAINEEQHEALIDHELEHLTVEYDRDGEAKRDVDGRVCYRIRKHDIEQFSSNLRRYGIWMEDLKEIVTGTLRKRLEPLFADHDDEQSTVPMTPPKSDDADQNTSAAMA